MSAATAVRKKHTYTHTHVCTRTQTCAHMHARINAHIHTHMCIHTNFSVGIPMKLITRKECLGVPPQGLAGRNSLHWRPLWLRALSASLQYSICRQRRFVPLPQPPRICTSAANQNSLPAALKSPRLLHLLVTCRLALQGTVLGWHFAAL